MTLAVDSGYAEAAKELNTRRESVDQIGAIGFGTGAKPALEAVTAGAVACAAIYYGEGIAPFLDKAGEHGRPVMFHFADPDAAVFDRLQLPFPRGRGFRFNRGIAPGFAEADKFDKSSFTLAYTRTLELLRRALGPHYDLDALRDRHSEFEFATRDVDATMATMVPEPYVNHIPTMTGGVGYRDLHRFYKNHFIPKTPKDTPSSPSRAPSAPTASWTRCSSPSPTTSRSIGCCRG